MLGKKNCFLKHIEKEISTLNLQHIRVPKRVPEDNPPNYPGEREEHELAPAGPGAGETSL